MHLFLFDPFFFFTAPKMQRGATEGQSGNNEYCDPLAAQILERQRNNVTKGTQQLYDCYLKGYLQYSAAKGYTSENHAQVIAMATAQ